LHVVNGAIDDGKILDFGCSSDDEGRTRCFEDDLSSGSPGLKRYASVEKAAAMRVNVAINCLRRSILRTIIDLQITEFCSVDNGALGFGWWDGCLFAVVCCPLLFFFLIFFD
jgi:hypothetical protein